MIKHKKVASSQPEGADFSGKTICPRSVLPLDTTDNFIVAQIIRPSSATDVTVIPMVEI